MLQLLPDAGLLPVAQLPPAGHPAAAAKLTGREQPPGHPGAQDVDDPAQHRPVLVQGRPPLGWGGLAGRGSIAAQTSSGTSCSAMVGVVMAAHHSRPTITL